MLIAGAHEIISASAAVERSDVRMKASVAERAAFARLANALPAFRGVEVGVLHRDGFARQLFVLDHVAKPARHIVPLQVVVPRLVVDAIADLLEAIEVLR